MIAEAMANGILAALLRSDTFERPAGDLRVTLFTEEPAPDFSNSYLWNIGVDDLGIEFDEVEPGVYANRHQVYIDELGEGSSVTITHFGIYVHTEDVPPLQVPLVDGPLDEPTEYDLSKPGVISAGAIRIPLGPVREAA